MKKTLAILLAAATAATLAGCGAAGNKTAGGTATGEKVSFILGLPGGDGVTAMKVVDNFVEANKDKYDITLDEASWGDFEQKINLQIAAKNDVTTVFVTDSLMGPGFGAKGALEDLSGRVKDLDASLYTAALTSVADTEGHLWGVPHDINPIAVVYNKDLFDAAGLEYPSDEWTYEEMFDMARKLRKDDVYGICYGTNITQGWLPFFAAVGVSPYKDDFRNSNLDDPKVQEAYEKYAVGYREDLCPSVAEAAAYGSPANMFAEGKIAMYVCQAGELASINGMSPDMNYDAQIMPVGWNGKHTCIYVPNIWCIYSGAADAEKDAAWEFIKYYLSEEGQSIVASEGPCGFPIMKSALGIVSGNGVKPEHKDAFYRGIDEFGMTILENPCSMSVEGVMQPLTNNVRDNTAPIPELLKKAKEDMQTELNYYYENL